MKFVLWLLSVVAGIVAWRLAVWGETLSFWPQICVWFLFFIAIDVYRQLENAQRDD